ncbi:site-2 protease family protein [Isoptericola sp. b441]|uniref:Zinc metalloprotease n=1 Tax=Actinotalea lenta TaxID=3064654 RepID=A0ABT9D9H4_9CELL|nr:MULTISPECIES: site-2 protease family protein [unclassified Isoptericola]MDO8107555.1 site-2 protease family protein [Isoptericola sp. b441]MDO8120785.1 site-2 protease family protein [Isoptericola sp. b490]
MSEPSPQRGWAQRGWVVGHAWGSPVVLSPGWLVAAVVLTALLLPFAQQLAPASGPGVVWLLALSAVLLLFVSTFLHELAHAGAARRYGMPVHRIALTLLGGHTELGERAPGPAASAVVAVVGPLTNLALGAVAWVVWRVGPDRGPVSALILALAVTNGFVAVLNLLPGLPLDGGRVLEAAVWGATGRRGTGTRVAGWVGRAVAAGIGLWSLLPALAGRPDVTRLLWGGLIAVFIWTGASQAIRGAALEEALDRLTVARLATPVVLLPADRTVADAGASTPPGHGVVVLGPLGQPVGYLDSAAVASVPEHLRAGTPLSAVVGPLPPEARVQLGLAGREAVEAVRVAAARSPVMAVVAADGSVVGLLRATDVVRALRSAGA